MSMAADQFFPSSITIFCRVVDYFGDIGVCWRLARQIAAIEEVVKVRLVVDDIATFHRICSDVDPHTVAPQYFGRIEISPWLSASDSAFIQIPTDLILETFGAGLPEEFLNAMALRVVKPAWINLEYLTAETWIEQYHCLPSPHASLPLVKHFFFPGFTEHTGGLLREKTLSLRRTQFQKNVDKNVFLAGRLSEPSWKIDEQSRLVSLFCYPNAPVEALLAAMADVDAARYTVCLVPEGIATEQISHFLGAPAVAGTSRKKGKLCVAVIGMTNQDDYDQLLWACDVNFVRGEDSFLRAQWAARPAIWQIYPQQGQAHIPKLNAFVERYVDAAGTDLRPLIAKMFEAWNGNGDIALAWESLIDSTLLDDTGYPRASGTVPNWPVHARNWVTSLEKQPDLVTKLLRYARKVG